MSVEVSNMARCSSKSDELRNINSIGYRARNIIILKKRKIDNFKNQKRHVYHEISLEMNKCKPKIETSASEVFALLS